MKKAVIRICERIDLMSLSKNDATQFFDRANREYSLKDYAGAIKDYTEAINRDDGEAGYYNNRGVAKGRLKDYTGAIKDYTEAINRDDGKAGYYNNRGNAKVGLKDYAGAIKDYTEAINRDDGEGSYYYSRGNAEYNLKNYTNAIKDYTEAINRNQGNGSDKDWLIFNKLTAIRTSIKNGDSDQALKWLIGYDCDTEKDEVVSAFVDVLYYCSLFLNKSLKAAKEESKKKMAYFTNIQVLEHCLKFVG